MFVGEIGISRHDFLYDIRFWEVRRIIRGYRKRDRLKHQLLAEVIYTAKYANPYRKYDGKKIEEMFPGVFEDDDDYIDEPAITEAEAKELQDEMAALNAQGEAF